MPPRTILTLRKDLRTLRAILEECEAGKLEHLSTLELAHLKAAVRDRLSRVESEIAELERRG